MLPQYADHDNDGLPDHLMGDDGMWQPFDPHTGTMLGAGSSLNPASPGGNSSTGVTSTGVGGGVQGRLPTPPIFSPPALPPASGSSHPVTANRAGAGGGAARPGPAYANGQRHPLFGGEPRNPGGPFGGQSAPRTSPLQSQRGSPLYGAGPSSGGGGGGGGDVRGLISSIRGNVMGSLSGMGGGGYSSGGGGSYSFPGSGSTLSSPDASTEPSPFYDPMSTALSALDPMVGAMATGMGLDPRAVAAYQAVGDSMIQRIMSKGNNRHPVPLYRASNRVQRRLF